VDRLPLTGLMLAGGDTARAALRALGAPGLKLLGEVLPGVPLGTVGDHQILTKSGGFGGDDTLIALTRMLRGDR
jgi:uncharacterized protein YgbK (DUF1537 family)